MNDDYIIVNDYPDEKYIDVSFGSSEPFNRVDNYIENDIQNMIIFNAIEYIDTIIDSYKKPQDENSMKNSINNNIYEQWRVDFPRQVTKINGNVAIDTKFIEYATMYSTIFFMFATQPLFFLPFYEMQQMYGTPNVVVIDNNQHKICEFSNNKETITIKFTLIVSLFNIELEKNIRKIETEMIIDFNTNNKKINKYGILTWK